MNTFNLRIFWAAILLFCLPSAVMAVGLGKINVTSGLGQPLRAEIALLSVQKDELSSIVARVASAAAYKDANIERTGLAASLKFSVAQRSNGESYLKVTSTQAVNEPFLDVLIELSWSSGRLLREYTVLLDPPGYTAPDAVAPVAVPQIRSAPATVARPAAPPAPTTSVTVDASPAPASPAAADTSKTPAPSPVASVKPGKRQRAVAAGPKAVPTPAEQTFPKFDESGAPTAAAASADSGPSKEYAIKRGDTLNKIATELKVESVSLEQMLAGLYQANPQAFTNKNMNRLRVGQILRVPPAEELTSIEQGAARKQVKAQVTDWNNYRQKLAQATEAAPVVPESGKQSASGAITSAVEDKAATTTPRQDVLKLSKGDASSAKTVGGSAGGSASAAQQEKLRLLEEENIAKEKSLKEANSRVAALESNVKDMQRLLEIRNQALADLQKQANKTTPAVPTTSSATPPAATPPAKPTGQVIAPPATPVAPAPVIVPPSTNVTAPAAPVAPTPPPLLRALPDTTAPATPSSPVSPSTPPAGTAPLADSAATPPRVDAPAPADKTVATPKPVTAPAAGTPKAEEQPLFSTIAGNPLYLGAAVVALLLLAALALMWRSSQRRKNLSSFEDSIMTGGDLKANTVFGDTAGGVIDTGDTSFLTDFSQAGMGTIDTNDVDPIAEAEVYMAYGRDAQAEEILKEALSKDPSRHEIQVKLLEIYASRKNVTAYETLAGELYAAIGGRSHPLWHKVAEMGRELDPNNPLYAPEALGASTKTDAIPAAGLAAGVVAGAALAASTNRDEDTIGGLDFSLDSDAEDENLATTEHSHDLEFDAPSGERAPSWDAASFKDEAPLLPDESNNKSSLDFARNESSLDFDSTIPQAVTKQGFAQSPSIAEEEAVDDIENSFDLDLDLEESIEGPPTIAPAVESPASDFEEIYKPVNTIAPQARAPEVDLSHIDLDLGEKSKLADDFDGEMVFTDTESHWEEVATKLDLAKAYIDMGDKDGAREILQEVVEEGEPEQKTDAKKLLAALV